MRSHTLVERHAFDESKRIAQLDTMEVDQAFPHAEHRREPQQRPAFGHARPSQTLLRALGSRLAYHVARHNALRWLQQMAPDQYVDCTNAYRLEIRLQGQR